MLTFFSAAKNWAAFVATCSGVQCLFIKDELEAGYKPSNRSSESNQLLAGIMDDFLSVGICAILF
jgi:hypothetical protein